MLKISGSGRKKRKTKSNLKDFDVEKISAELDQVESRMLNIDPQAVKNLKTRTGQSSGLADGEKMKAEKESVRFKPRETNVVDFTPQRSELLHSAVRRSSEAVESSPAEPKMNASQARNEVKSKLSGKSGKSFGLKVKTSPSAPRKAGNKAKLKPEAIPNSAGNARHDKTQNRARAALRSPSPESVALRSLYQAGRFNSAAKKSLGTSLDQQRQKAAIFENGLTKTMLERPNLAENAVSPRSRGLLYNSGSNVKLMGGVDQHNLETGKIRRLFKLRSVKFLAPLAAIVVISVAALYSNLSNFNLKMAENRAGISIAKPEYIPDGFSLQDSVSTGTGEAELKFSSGDKTYSVSQSQAEWDSSALLENKVLKESKEYSAYTDRGLTIYVYDGKAVWVNQGKINEVDSGNSELQTEDLIRIAGSM